MHRLPSCEQGFTLVELMVVVFVIGILVTIAVPVYQSASAAAQSNSCQANQRTVEDAVAVYVSQIPGGVTSTQGQLASGGTGWYALLVPDWLKSAPACPVGHTNYLMSVAGDVIGDQGSTLGFKGGHSLP